MVIDQHRVDRRVNFTRPACHFSFVYLRRAPFSLPRVIGVSRAVETAISRGICAIVIDRDQLAKLGEGGGGN